jgi:hypothetical protein
LISILILHCFAVRAATERGNHPQRRSRITRPRKTDQPQQLTAGGRDGQLARSTSPTPPM